MQINIIYGSETGNCESLAKDAQKFFVDNNISAIVEDMSDVTFDSLQSYQNLIVITSTWGDGEPPSNAIRLHDDLASAKDVDLSNLNYAVFAIGQSFYDYFCQAGKDFDEYLSNLGANRIKEITLCDDDFDEIFQPWLNTIKGLL